MRSTGELCKVPAKPALRCPSCLRPDLRHVPTASKARIVSIFANKSGDPAMCKQTLDTVFQDKLCPTVAYGQKLSAFYNTSFLGHWRLPKNLTWPHVPNLSFLLPKPLPQDWSHLRESSCGGQQGILQGSRAPKCFKVFWQLFLHLFHTS